MIHVRIDNFASQAFSIIPQELCMYMNFEYRSQLGNIHRIYKS